jgi:hypothetical protein
MAVAGSGGWIPSALYALRRGELVQITIAQNAPSYLVADAPTAAERLRQGEITRIDVRGGRTLAEIRKRLQ